MKRIASFVLTTALVLGMGASAFAAARTPSKVVLDEVKADASATVSGLSGLVAKVEIKKAEDVAKTTEEKKQVEKQNKDVLDDIKTMDLKKVVNEVLPQKTAADTEGQKKADTKVEVAAFQTFNVETENLADSAKVVFAMESEIIDSVYTENEELAVVIAVPEVDAAGNVTYTYHHFKGVYRGGKICVELKGKELKNLGSTFTMTALKQVEQKAV